ncbi:MAG: hypothetical protein K8S87_11485 [Planctomycetes bacterium]|nr:hypothetical protein [Planctomycetota bacterium]
MKIALISLLLLILSMSGCGLFSNSDKEPSLDSGKDLKIWVDMPYEDAREALLDFNCEVYKSSDVMYIVGEPHPYFKAFGFGFKEFTLWITADKENAEDTLKVVGITICNSKDLMSNKGATGYKFDKLTVSDGEMNIEGLEDEKTKIYMGMDYTKAKEIIKNAGVTDIVVDKNEISYKTNYKVGYDDNGQPKNIFNYQVSVSISFKKKANGKNQICSILISWEYELANPQYENDNIGTDVKCDLIDVTHPHGLQWGGKIIE